MILPLGVPCPRRRLAGEPCGQLVGENGSRVRSPSRYHCNKCGWIWSARDVRALILSRAARSPPPDSDVVVPRQLGLPGLDESDR